MKQEMTIKELNDRVTILRDFIVKEIRSFARDTGVNDIHLVCGIRPPGVYCDVADTTDTDNLDKEVYCDVADIEILDK